MTFPERFSNLPEYAFPRLRALLDAHAPGDDPIAMTIGEPRHPFPAWIAELIVNAQSEFGNYPPNEGTAALLEAITDWFRRRFGLTLGSDQVMPLNGSREGLFSAALALCPEQKSGVRTKVLIPNPFYQVYAVGAAAAGAEPVFVPATAQTGFLPDYASLPKSVLDATGVAFICTPSNPQGAVADKDYLKMLIALAERHDFRVFSDECYSEIYREAAPLSALQVAKEMGADPDRVVVFNSLSKRSNLPGLRSGVVAGGKASIAAMLQLRSYAGAPLPLPLQRVAEKVWADESHVDENRALYGEKYRIAEEILSDIPNVSVPDAGFFLWLPVEDGEAAAARLWKETGVRVLPGAYLGRNAEGGNPGQKFIRVAMVAPKEEMARGLTRLCECLYR